MAKAKINIKDILKCAVFLLITLLWLGFIYSNSLKNGVESGEDSNKVFEIVNKITAFLGFEDPVSEHFIRKAAHFTEFAVLSALICLDIWVLGAASMKKKFLTSLLWLSLSVPLSAFFAATDELLQNFSDGRAPSVTDVFIDSSGAFCATVFCVLIFFVLYRAKRVKREEKY